MLRGARVATVVLNYRSTQDTAACVRALRASTYLDQSLVVVDNGPEGPAHDELREAVGEVDAVLATGHNLGYAAGNNVGIRAVLDRGPEYLWLVNPDLLVEPETLERLVATADETSDAAAIGPRIVLGGTDPPVLWFDGGILGSDGRTGHVGMGRPEADHPPRGAHDTGYVTGACMLVRRRGAEHVGLLPEQYFLYFEETHLCQSLRRRGWRLLVDDRARAVHHKRSSGDLPTASYVYYMVRNKVLFSRWMGFDEAATVQQFSDTFIRSWREQVESTAPDWTPVFDQLVADALADAEQGRTGRRDDIADRPAAGSSST